jgi:uncharacterized protein with PCYCGC motif
MGRKSSAKSQLRQGAGSTPVTSDATRRFPPLLIVATLGLLVALVAVVYVRSSGSSASPQAQKSDAPAQQLPLEPPAAAKLGPHPQENLPPLPFSPEPPARPAEVVRAAYKFAAEHPEVLSYVPCYCGCERTGHRGNEDCFVTARDANGDVTAWEPHGMT